MICKPSTSDLGRHSDPQKAHEHKSLLHVLHGNAVWPPPIWLMRQAGRYLPEFRAHREKTSFLKRCLTPEIATELTLQPIHRFKMDGAILFSDILILPHAMGQDLDFVENTGPVLDPIRNDEALSKLNPHRVPEFIAPICATLTQLRSELPAKTTLLGFAGSPFTVSCYMIDGRSSRDYGVTRLAMIENPEFYARTIDLITKATIALLIQQIDAGADAVMLFDSWAGLLPPSQFRRWVIAPTKKIVSEIHQARPGVKIIGFPRLAGLMASLYAQESGIDALACDTSTNLEVMSTQIPQTMPLQGNLDPLILCAGGSNLKQEAELICRSMKGRPHIFNLGHGVLPNTPPQHVADLIAAIRELR